MPQAEPGIELGGPNGLLSQLTKRMLEMRDHLGYDKHDPVGRNHGNCARVQVKTKLTEIGMVKIDVALGSGSLDSTGGNSTLPIITWICSTSGHCTGRRDLEDGGASSHRVQSLGRAVAAALRPVLVRERGARWCRVRAPSIPAGVAPLPSFRGTFMPVLGCGSVGPAGHRHIPVEVPAP